MAAGSEGTASTVPSAAAVGLFFLLSLIHCFSLPMKGVTR